MILAINLISESLVEYTFEREKEAQCVSNSTVYLIVDFSLDKEKEIKEKAFNTKFSPNKSVR